MWTPPCSSLIEAVADQLTTVEHFILFNAPKDVQTKLPNVSFYEDLMAAASDEYTWRSTDEQIGHGAMLSSGTAATPRVRSTSHRSMFLHTLGECFANALQGPSQVRRVLPVVLSSIPWPGDCPMRAS